LTFLRKKKFFTIRCGTWVTQKEASLYAFSGPSNPSEELSKAVVKSIITPERKNY